MPQATLSADPSPHTPASLRAAGPLDPRQVGPELVAALTQHTDRRAALSELSDFARRLTNGLFAVYLARNPDDRLFPLVQSLPYQEQSLPPDLLQRLVMWGELACEYGQARIDALPGEITIITVPIERREALSVALLLGEASVEPFLLGVQLLSALAPFVGRQADGRDSLWEAESTAAILDLSIRLAAARDVKAGCRLIVDQLAQHLGCQRAAIGLLRSATGRCRLAAISGMHDFDPRAPLPRTIEEVLEQAAGQESAIVFDGETAGDATAAALVRVANSGGLIAARLRTPAGETIGAWVFLDDASLTGDPARQRFIAAASEAVAAGLGSLKQRRLRLWPAKTGGSSHGRRSWFRLALVVLVIAVATTLGLPVDYKIACQCQLQPATRRFVAAPFAGVLEKSLAAPGDLVAKDHVLGLMDGKEIRWELASIAAEQQRVSKAHDVNLAAGKVAAAQIDRLEMERLEQKRLLLEHRAANLQIRSPIDGILLSGDLKRSEGVPLTVGQRLYEVAPLEQLIVEVVVPDEEVSRVAPGQSVAIRLDAFAGRSWEGPLERIDPRSELRDNENVFIGDVAIANEGLALRPGMKGRAKIASGPQRLGWILFHSPWNRLVDWLGW
jgi:hypothetical protein